MLVGYEAQYEHRISIEAQTITGNVQAQRLGQRYAFILAVGVLALGAFFAQKGELPYAFATVLVEVLGLATVFLVGRHSQSDELDAKRQHH